MIPIHSDRHIEILPEESRTQPLKLLWIVLCLRSGLFLVEFITGFRVHSLSLIALSSHLFVDLSAIAIAIFAAWLVNHFTRNKLPLNSGQIETVAALVNNLNVRGVFFHAITDSLTFARY